MMSVLRRLSIQDRIFIGVGAMLLLMVAMFAMDTAAERTQASLSSRIIAKLIPARSAARNASRWILRAGDDGASYILANGSPVRNGFLRQYRADLEHTRLELLDAQRLSDLSTTQMFMGDFQRKWARFEQNAQDAFLLAATGHAQAARRQYLRVSYQPALDVLNRYDAAIQAEIAKVQAQHAANRTTARVVGASLNIGALGLGAIIAVRLGGSLRRRLSTVSRAISDVAFVDIEQLTASFREIALGNFTAPRYVCTRKVIPESGGSELADLAASYNQLIGGFAEMSFRIDDAAMDAQRRKEAEEALSYLKHHDQVTGLANRALLQQHLESAIALQGRDRRPIAVAYVRLEGLRQIEDAFGHHAGDELQRLAAERIGLCIRSSDAIARDGVDEFIILLDSVSGRDEAQRVVADIVDATSKPYLVDEHAIFVRTSGGLSIYPDDGLEADDVLRNAHTAMVFAGASERGEVCVYGPGMRKQSMQRLTVEADLQRALGAHEFELYYQPIVSVRSGRVSGVEALIRWRHPEQGILAPAAFMDVAEQTGIIEPLGAWVLRAACMQTQVWRKSGFDIHVSVNVSMRQLYRTGLLVAVREALQESHLPAQFLELELTESVILSEREAAVKTLTALQNIGIRVAIDDFGTGYSWYGYLRYFSPDTLKLDRSFVANITRNTLDEAIAEAMILLGHNLHLNVVAEGVEDANQMLILHKLDCDQMQGFFFASPSPPDQCEEILRRRDVFSGILGRAYGVQSTPP